MLLGFPDPELEAEAGPGAAGLPADTAVPFPEDLDGGERGRFLNKKVLRGRKILFYVSLFISSFFSQQSRLGILNS